MAGTFTVVRCLATWFRVASNTPWALENDVHRRAKISAGPNDRPENETIEGRPGVPDDGNDLVKLQAAGTECARPSLLVRRRDEVNDKRHEQIDLEQRRLSRGNRKPTESQGPGAQCAGRGARVRLFGAGSILGGTFIYAAEGGGRIWSSPRQLEKMFKQSAGSTC
jgi:hypothetical protein